MFVRKRDGTKQKVLYDKITSRIRKLCYGLNPHFVDAARIAQQVISGLYDGITTSELDTLAAETCAAAISTHPDFGVLAARIFASNLQKTTQKRFSEVATLLHDYIEPKTQLPAPLLSEEVYEFIKNNADALDAMIVHDRDFEFDYFGLRTLCRSYLLKIDGAIAERPQHLFMRVACGLYYNNSSPETDDVQQRTVLRITKQICDEKAETNQEILNQIETLLPGCDVTKLLALASSFSEQEKEILRHLRDILHSHGKLPTPLERIKELYDLMSQRYCIFGSPTLFNAGLPHPQLSSCFLSTMKDDSIEGIFDTLKDSALISKHAGGQSIAVHNIRASGSYIRSTNGTSNGLVPMLRVFDASSQYVDQGGGKRKGSTAIYLEPWHADIEAFLDLRKNTGAEELRCRHLFIALWMNDEFMDRVERDEMWSLFCPNEAPGLADVWGEQFKELYVRYETETPHLIRKRISARALWSKVKESMMETGTPYFLFKDACNKKSNQKHLGTIRCSNLCAEIIQFTSPSETAVCNLGSIALNQFVDPVSRRFDFEKLMRVTNVMIRAENKVIDIGWLPTKEARYSNQRSRAIGLGVQGFYDACMLMRIPFDSKDAAEWNIQVFETMYFAACEASWQLAMETGSSYDTFQGSPMSQGQFQFDLWGTTPSNRHDFDLLRTKIMKDGMKNSLLLALMPTASTSQILGNYESFEPASSLLYIRRTLAGEFVVVSKYLVRDLLELGLWSTEMKNTLIAHRGSIQDITEIPLALRELHKTVWDIKQKVIVDMCADRGPFICQTQSMNIHMANPTHSKLDSLLFYAKKRDLKTGLYYLRTKAATEAIPVTVDPALAQLVQQRARSQKPQQEQAEKRKRTDTEETKEQDSKRHHRALRDEDQEATMDRNANTFEPRETETIRRHTPHQEEENGSAYFNNKKRRVQENAEGSNICSLKNKEQCVSCGG